jgi:hypothetical protein
MNIEELKLYEQERHELVMRIAEIIEYSNLSDLKTINETLFEMGFKTKEETKKSKNIVCQCF